MGSNKNPRKVVDGKLKCCSTRHEGDRMCFVGDFCKSKTPDGYSYSCKACRTKENKLLAHARYKTWKQANPTQALLTGRKSDARKKGIEFDLTLDDIIIPTTCPVLGIPIVADNKPRTYNSPSIDRIDNTKGYTKDNIVICSWRANMLKKDATLEELAKLAGFYSKYIKRG